MTDITRRGSRDYDETQRRRVLGYFEILRMAANGKCVQVDDLAKESGMPGRTVRQIMTDADGVEFVLAGGDDGYRVAEYREDAEPLNDRLLHTSVSLMERVDRRQAFVERLPARQNALF